MKVIIVGAGVAGPVAALALQRAGIESVIHEARPPVNREEGSWMTVSPNGLDALSVVGALPVAQQIGVPTRTNVMYSASGRELGRLSLGRALVDGTPALSMKRSHLAAALSQECARRGIPIVHRSALVHADSSDDGVTAGFSDGRQVEADVLIGADGVHSRTRRLIDPAAPAARYVGLVNFGGITSAAEIVRGPRELEAWHFVFGRRAFFGSQVLPNGDVVWFVNEPRPLVTRRERETTGVETWLAHLADLFGPDEGPALELIRKGRLELAGDSTHDLGHVPTWHDRAMVVVGDAAHAPAPSSGQGASVAMEDGVVLAQALRDAPDVATGLAAYEARRRQRVEKIVAAGARSSSTKMPTPLLRPLHDAVLRMVFRYAVTEKSTAWMYDHRLDWDDAFAAS